MAGPSGMVSVRSGGLVLVRFRRSNRCRGTTHPAAHDAGIAAIKPARGRVPCTGHFRCGKR